jgi:LytS/YehU family sensor histidine kinase
MGIPELLNLQAFFTDQDLLNQVYQTGQILERSCIVIVAAFISLRFKSVRQAVRGAELKWRFRIPAILVFGMLAITGTHNGVIIDVSEGWRSADITAKWPPKLMDTQGIIGFRDTMTLISGFIGGPWVGFGTGLLAGAERCYLGGLAGLPSFFATLTLGFYAGLLRHFKPHWIETAIGIIFMTIIGTLIHRSILYFMIGPPTNWLFAKAVFVPVLVVNIFGCLLFFWVFRDLDREDLEKEVQEGRLLQIQSELHRDKLEKDAQEARLLQMQAELRALRAQVDPHFLNNTLNDIPQLILEYPDKAIFYVEQLAEFFNYTRKFAELGTITLKQELDQLDRYLELQKMGLGDKLQVSKSEPADLLDFKVVPGCLLTLVENTLKHGFEGRPAPYKLTISAQTENESLLLQVTDNGSGINHERLQGLGKRPVRSEKKGGGVALHQLLQSLQLTFGENVSLNFDSVLGKSTVVSLIQPKRSEP